MPSFVIYQYEDDSQRRQSASPDRAAPGAGGSLQLNTKFDKERSSGRIQARVG
jgi:hypothetical protein